jgi:non-specific serine/threonine protein kinase
LAIELAASRSNVLDPAGMLARLDHRLSLLRWEASDLPPRQRTLEAAVAWSYGLLTPAERAVFRRLAVFAGGWTAAAVAVVDPARPESERFDTLSSLVTKNLVVVEPTAPSGVGRFSFLETVRAFALAELAAAGEAAAFRRRHLAYVLSLAERAEPELHGPRQAAWLDLLEREHDNIRAALAFAATDDPATRLRLATALRRFWYTRGTLEDGLTRLTGALAAAPKAPATLRARAMAGAGCLAVWCGDYPRATALSAAAVTLARRADADYPAALALTQLAAVARFSGDLPRAEALLAEASLHYARCGSAAGLALTVRNRGSVARLRGDHAAATTLMTDALARYRAVGHQREIANTLTLLAEVQAERAGLAAAAALLHEALDVCGDLGHAGTIAFTADVVARLGIGVVAPERLGRLIGGADALRAASGFARTPAERDGLERVAAAVRAKLGEPGCAAAREAGTTQTRAAVVAEARAAVAEFCRPTASPAPPPPINGRRPGALSPRELAVLRLVAEGRSNKEIGVALFVSENTAKFHVTSILNKLGAGTRAQAAALATHRGLL